MTTPTQDRLYNLLPAIYRIKDVEQNQSLRALFAILEQEVLALEEDIEGLYDNWFIETCDEWVVPYIGELLKVPVLNTGGIPGFSLRSYVANVLAYRRRKGTASVLEQMAKDVSGWYIRAVEFQKSIATNQNLNHVRSLVPATVDLKDANKLELLGGPFQTAKYGVEIRSVKGGRGKYNIPNIGLFVWRLQSYYINRVQTARIDNDRFIINPLQVDMPLYNRPQTEKEITHIAEEHNVPGPLRRRPLYDELEARREDVLQGNTPEERYFGSQPVFQIYLDNSAQALPAEEISICDLSDWDTELEKSSSGVKVQIDPVLGRIAVPSQASPASIEISHAYGFSADMGGGPYNRSDSIEDLLRDQENVWWAAVSSRKFKENTKDTYETLAEAIDEWNKGDNNVGVIAIQDSYTYEEELTGDLAIQIKQGGRLLIVAADWLSGNKPADNAWTRSLGLNYYLVPSRLRPHIKGNISIIGSGGDDPGEIYFNGLLLESDITVLGGELGRLDITHCTLVPGKNKLLVNSTKTKGRNSKLAVNIDFSICGAITIPETSRLLTISDSIVDALEEDENGDRVMMARAITGGDSDKEYTPPLTIQRSTVFGSVQSKELNASEVIFDNEVDVKRLQTGCVRFSYVPPGSVVPKRFRCQPDLALSAALRVYDPPVEELPYEEIRRVELWMTPEFSSTRFGDPSYGQLSMGCPVCPKGITAGAEDGSEMGAFSHLKQAQREANIRTNLNEYLRFGMEAELFYVNYKEIAAPYSGSENASS